MRGFATRLEAAFVAPISVLLALAAAIPLTSAAPSPSSGKITEDAPELSYSGGPMFVSAPPGSPVTTCPNDTTFSEIFNLTTELPADLDTRRPGDSIRIDVAAVDSADMVLTLRDSGGAVLASADTNVFGAGEVIWTDARPGTTQYRVLVCLFAGSTPSYAVRIALVPERVPPPPPPPIPGSPRHVTLVSPPRLGDSAAEPSIGYNLKTRRAMYIANVQTLKVTPPEYSGTKDAAGQPLPMSCPATWSDVSFDTTSVTTFDPILFTNQTLGEGVLGRTFVSQLTFATSLFAYTDDDGATWIPAQQGPPNGGVDHQTVGAGPYPAPSATFSGAPPGNPGYAVYYCSQSDVDAFCARSDTGGQTFGSGIPIGKATGAGCGAGDFHSIHGHVRVAADGALAIPMRICGGQQGFILSTDAGTTYSARKVPGTTSGKTDPQLAWSKPDAAGKINGYFCFVDGDGRPKATTTGDRGLTWSSPYDLGAQHGIRNAVFAQAIAGDFDRAACAFLGTTTAGDINSKTFPGTWYGYLSYTFDGGQSWTTFNVTPNDPVQKRAGICTFGVLCGSSTSPRNLLDFNELALDEKGRVWFAYADGCVSESCVTDPTAGNDNAAKATIARQVGGRALYDAFDSQLPGVPQAPCLSGTRDAGRTSLSWVEPDDGGQAITAYRLYRASAIAGPYLLVGVTPADKRGFDDLTADPEVPVYFYKVAAAFGGGEGLFSNLLDLSVTDPGSACTLPGLTILTDKANDAVDQAPSHDIRSLSIAQPYFANDDYKLAFSLKMESLETLPPNAWWLVHFCEKSFPCQDPDLAFGENNKYFIARMSTVAPATPSAPVFELVKPQESGNQPMTVGLSPADGNGFTPGGLITIVVNAADLGLAKAGRGTDKLSRLQARIRVSDNTGQNRGPTVDIMPDKVSASAEFTTVPVPACAPNSAPLAELSVDPPSGNAPLTVAFTGSATDQDPSDTIATYALDFGDGTPPLAQSDGSFPPHTYEVAGNYPARLFVVDSRDKRSSNTAEKIIPVVADHLAPRASLTAVPPAVVKGNSVTLDASASSDPNGYAIVEFTFDAGDGSAAVRQPQSSRNQVYLLGGTYTASVSVMDAQGDMSAPATATVTVVNTAPSAVLTANRVQGSVPLTVTFDASASTDPDSGKTNDRVMRYDFDFGDGTAPETTIVPATSHVYALPGVYQVLLRVYDQEGKASEADALLPIDVVANNDGPSGGGFTFWASLALGLLRLTRDLCRTTPGSRRHRPHISGVLRNAG